MLPNVLQPNTTDHVPVLADEVRALLALEPGHTLVDATFGAGGHATLLARDLKGEGKVIAIDRDPTVRPYFERFRRTAGVTARFLRGDFSIVLAQLADNGVRADAILLDLGVSSMQLDRPERGFSYATDAPLDMRMDPSADYSARELINEASERDLTRIFRQYGEERYAKQIARDGCESTRGVGAVKGGGQGLMASWQATATAPARHSSPRARPKPRPARRRKAKPRFGVAGGLAWILVTGLLLAGIVALNVAVLRLNVKLDKLNTERDKLRAGNAALAVELSSAASSPRIQALAQQRGLVPADPATTTYVDLSRRAR